MPFSSGTSFLKIAQGVCLACTFWPLFLDLKKNEDDFYTSASDENFQHSPENVTVFKKISTWEFLATWDDDANFLENKLFDTSLAWLPWLQHIFFTSLLNVYEPVACMHKYVYR